VYFYFKRNDGRPKSSAVSLMRIKFATGLEDFVIKKEIKSEIDGAVLSRKVFINYLQCVE
jgi:hypothetical protein